jgi:hypothetical protein
MKRLPLRARINLSAAGTAKVGLDRKTYGAHSMRAGFVTAAMLAGISETRIAEHTGNRDMNVLRLYYRNGMVFKGNPGQGDRAVISGLSVRPPRFYRISI